MSKAKLCTQARQNKKFIHQFPGVGGCLATPRSRGNGWTCDCYWERQMPSLQISCSPFLCPHINVPGMKPFDMKYPLDQLASAVLAVSPPNSFCTSLMVWSKGQRRLWLSLSTAKSNISLNYHHYFQHKSKIQPIPVTIKKINYIPAQTSIHHLWCQCHRPASKLVF